MSGRHGTRRILLLTLLLFVTTACSQADKPPQISGPGITFVAPRGSRPSAQSIAWSPVDATNMLVRAYETPDMPAEIYLLDVGTGQKTMLVKQWGQFYGAQWAPDAKHVLILAVNDTPGFEPDGWWIMDPASLSAVNLLPVSASYAAWSPDGTQIAVLRQLSPMQTLDLFLVDVKTGQKYAIFAPPGGDASTGLSWSSDGQRVVFSVLNRQGANNLYMLGVASRTVAKLEKFPSGQEPAWSPSGDVIAVSKWPYLYLVSPDGTCALRIPNVREAWSPTWSPDGQKLGFVSMDGIYYVDLRAALGRDVYQDLCSAATP